MKDRLLTFENWAGSRLETEVRSCYCGAESLGTIHWVDCRKMRDLRKLRAEYEADMKLTEEALNGKE